MRIILLVPMANADSHFQPGQETEWEDVDAGRLITAGLARPVRQAAPERAVAAGGEQAVTR